MLAYLFWHRPSAGVGAADYENRLRAFHSQLNIRSASFLVSALPFTDGGGYEDWYLVGNWAELGALSDMAVSGESQMPHDAIAQLAGEGWGAVYRLVRGECRPPLANRWASKPVGRSYRAFLDSVTEPVVWQRQMVLGPAPEFCILTEGQPAEETRTPIYVHEAPWGPTAPNRT
jgi:hypothetical protein